MISGGLLIGHDWLHAQGLMIPQQAVAIGRDFVNLWIGGKLAWAHMLDRLYDVPAYLVSARDHFPGLGQHNYSYPPQSLMLGSLFALLPYPVAFALWTVATAGLFLFAARPFMRGRPAWLALLTPAALVNGWAGQYGFLAGALWLFAFGAMERDQKRAGIAAGLLTIKPHLGLLIPILWVLRRRWIAIGVAVAVTAGTVLASGLIFGFGLWADYAIRVPVTQRLILTAPDDHFFFRMMPTTLIALRGLPPPAPMIGQATTALAALALVWRARHAAPADLAFIAATATFLILPYAFDYDMTVAALGFGLLVATRWHRLAAWEAPVLCLAYLTPGRMVAFDTIAQWSPPLILLAALWIQVRHATEDQESAA